MTDSLIRILGGLLAILACGGVWVSGILFSGLVQQPRPTLFIAFGFLAGITLLVGTGGISLALAPKPRQLRSLAPNWVKYLGGGSFVLVGLVLLAATFIAEPPSSVGTLAGAAIFLTLGIRIMKHKASEGTN